MKSDKVIVILIKILITLLISYGMKIFISYNLFLIFYLLIEEIIVFKGF
jgi:hypothetical protein